MQQLTCKMVGSFSFYSLLLSFRVFELNKAVVKPLNSKKSPGGKILKTLKKCEKVWKSAKKFEKVPR